MTKYSIGPLHFEFLWDFEWRTRRHDRIFRVVDAYCRQNLNTDQLGVVALIIETQLYPHCDGKEPCLHSGKELKAVLHELQRRGYGTTMHTDLIAQEELWEFFQWVSTNGAVKLEKIGGVMTPVSGCVLEDACDLHVEVYRWRNPGKLDREDWSAEALKEMEKIEPTLNLLARALAYGYTLGFWEGQEKDAGAVAKNRARNVLRAEKQFTDAKAFTAFLDRAKHLSKQLNLRMN